MILYGLLEIVRFWFKHEKLLHVLFRSELDDPKSIWLMRKNQSVAQS